MLNMRYSRYAILFPASSPSRHPANDSSVTQWEAHILTKQHRASVTREKASQAKSTKRQAEEPLKTEVKKAKIKSTEIQSSILPAGFFDNAAAAVSTPDDGDEDDSPEPAPAPVPTQPKASTSKSAPQQPAKPQPTGDSELDAFLSSLDEPELVDAPATAAASTSASVPRQRNISPGLSMGVASYSAAPVRNIPEQKKDPDEEDEPEPEETEAERRARVEREEREEIMGRLEAEQRAQ